jgi:molybdenum cofactor cytidylyltransferase
VKIAGIVLAAGLSRRLGYPKQNVVLAGETLLHRTVRLARDAGLSPIIVVVREGTECTGFPALPDVVIVVNQDADEGIASSIRRGVAEASRHTVAGAVILTCDQPALRSGHLRTLIEDPHRLTASSYNGSVGVPAYFPFELFGSLLQLRGDQGARGLLKDAYAVQAEELDLDIDTEHDLDVARSLLDRPSQD